MGGTIWSISRPGRWTSTLFSLPISLVTFSRMRAAFYRGPKPRKIRTNMRSGSALFLTLLVATVALGAPPRVTFERRVPAPFDLGAAEDVALISAIGDGIHVEYLAEHFVEQTNRTGTLRMFDARAFRHPFVLEILKKKEPADAYIVVRAFTCSSADRGGEGSQKDPDGKRVRRATVWVEAKCHGRVDLLTAAGTRHSFTIKGDGTSSRGPDISEDDREDAVMHAARFAAIDATEKIAPRRVREAILLDETAPRFDEAFAMIEAGKPEDARALWVSEIRKHPGLASLRFNLAALSEALGDRTAAEQHYAAARQLAPGEKRYANEHRSFIQRGLRKP